MCISSGCLPTDIQCVGLTFTDCAVASIDDLSVMEAAPEEVGQMAVGPLVGKSLDALNAAANFLHHRCNGAVLVHKYVQKDGSKVHDQQTLRWQIL